jgi:ABC-type phosphate/phosphonate transport system substrate-binding protein
MVERHPPCRLRPALVAAAFTTALLLAASATTRAQDKKMEVLKIGSSGSFSAGSDKKKEEGALETLRDFIKEETMLNNTIARQKDWGELAQKLSKGELHLGVFQGYEFAWAQEKYPELKPLALAVNVHRYATVHVLVKKDKGPKDFAGLAGQPVSIPTGERTLVMYAEHLIGGGKTVDKYFGKISEPENVEDALDDVVDGKVQAALVERAGLDAYKRRKPGRFNQLKDIAKSEPLPPTVIAYYDKLLPEDTLKTFRDGVLGASKKEKGQTVLTLFRLTGFETAPDDFAKVLANTRKTYPPAVTKAPGTN